MDRSLSLSLKAQESIEIKMKELLAKTSSECVVLISKDGLFLNGVGNLSLLDTTALAALVAGAYSATLELAKLLGEEGFSILFQQGTKWNVQITLVNKEAMMVIVFRDSTKIGLVRLLVNKSIADIAPHLTRAIEETEKIDSPDLAKFKEHAANLIDRIFRE